MSMKNIFLLACVLPSLWTNAQVGSAADSTRYVLNGDIHVSGMGGLSIHGGSMGLSDHIFSGVGGGGGILLDQRLMIGGYGQGLANTFIHEDFVENDRSYQGTLTFGHGGFWGMYSFSPKAPVHLFASFQIGWGDALWRFDDPDDEDDGYVPDSLRVPDAKRDAVVVFTSSMGAEFNVLRWFRPNVYIGYRSVSGLDLPGLRNNDLDGAIIGVNLLFGGFGDPR